MQNQGGVVWSISDLETSVAIVMEMIGIMSTTIIFSNMLLLIDRTMEPVEELNKKLDAVNAVSESLQLPHDLARKCLEYVENTESGED
jgi:hypothetical protein